MKEGVPFISGFNFFTDIMKMVKFIETKPYGFNMFSFKQDAMGQKVLPPVVGMCFFGEPRLFFNNHECLQDFYINQNSKATKSKSAAAVFLQLFGKSILMMQSKDPVYVAKRKTLSAAFFKSKLIGLTKIIKECTVDEIKTL